MATKKFQKVKFVTPSELRSLAKEILAGGEEQVLKVGLLFSRFEDKEFGLGFSKRATILAAGLLESTIKTATQSLKNKESKARKEATGKRMANNLKSAYADLLEATASEMEVHVKHREFEKDADAVRTKWDALMKKYNVQF